VDEGKGKRQDLQDVIRSETRRGKRPVDIEERRHRTELQRQFRFLLESGTRDDFVKAIRALGLKDGSLQFEQALAFWNEYGPR
jgi:hypothetical protein